MAHFDRLRMEWIDGQLDYLSRKMARRAARREVERDYVFAGFVVGILAALAALWLDLLGWRGQLWWTVAWTLGCCCRRWRRWC